MASRTARKGTSRYKIRNWKQYEAGLIQRGSIRFWINDDAIDQWNPEAKDKTRGRQEEYSDLAIQICLTFRLLYRQALRQTEGFINSLLKLMDLDLICPDHTTLSRRSQTLKELQEQLKKVQKKESIHILIDSTGLKIYGEGEWEEAKHGKGRRKGWMKLHLAIDENWHWCTNRYFDKNIVGLLFFHHFHLKIWLSWHLAQQGKVQVVIK